MENDMKGYNIMKKLDEESASLQEELERLNR